MKLAVSNLAWDIDQEEDVAVALHKNGVKFVELAPTKRWPDPSTVSTSEARAYLQWWTDHGLTPVALQSILFGHPELTIFEDEPTRRKLLDYLSKVMKLASTLETNVLVFGSPKNRHRGTLSPEAAEDIAVPFFRAVGQRAEDQGVLLCIEPNAPQYDCDFVTTANDGAALVAHVDSPGFGLHLDAACMTLAGDTPADAGRYKPRHFHASAPYLGPLDDNQVDYRAFADALKAANYDGYISIEMRPQPSSNFERTLDAVALTRKYFPF